MALAIGGEKLDDGIALAARPMGQRVGEGGLQMLFEGSGKSEIARVVRIDILARDRVILKMFAKNLQ